MESKKLSAKEVCELLGFTRTTLWRYVKTGVIPEPKRRANGYYIYWEESEIEKIRKNNVF